MSVGGFVDQIEEWTTDAAIGNEMDTSNLPFTVDIDYDRNVGTTSYAGIGWVEYDIHTDEIEYEIDYKTDIDISTWSIGSVQKEIDSAGKDETNSDTEGPDAGSVLPTDTEQQVPLVAIPIGLSAAALLVALSGSDAGYAIGYALQDLDDNQRIIDEGTFRCARGDSNTSGSYRGRGTVEGLTEGHTYRLLIAVGATASAPWVSRSVVDLNVEIEDIVVGAEGTI